MSPIAIFLRNAVARRISTYFCGNQRLLGRLIVLIEMPYYAVARGKVPGIYPTWSECSAQVQSFTGARYKKFSTETEAREFMNENSSTAAASSTSALLKTSSQNPNASAIVALESVNSELAAVKANFASFVETTENALNSIGEKIQNAMKRLQEGEALPDSNGGSGSDPQPPRKKTKMDVDLDPLPKAEVDRLRSEGFVVDADGLVQVFTDGACSGNGYKGQSIDDVRKFFGFLYPHLLIVGIWF